jgi:site-specific DNA-methyltransferase (adenine-specific)
MKPLDKKTYIDQALANGKGCTWLDDGRIPADWKNDPNSRGLGYGFTDGVKYRSESLGEIDGRVYQPPSGRFPANLLVEDEVLSDGIERKSGALDRSRISAPNKIYGSRPKVMEGVFAPDSGSFSRYFSLDAWWDKRISGLPPEVQKTFPFLLVPKASTAEKEAGIRSPSLRKEEGRANIHISVKPVKLMSYLITIGSRKGDLVLDPFCGSGTTGVAAQLLDRDFIGCELDEEFVEIARKRIGGVFGPLFAGLEGGD